MNAPNPLAKDVQTAGLGPNEPSMTEVLSSIRRIIADDLALSESLDEARKEAQVASSRIEHAETSARGVKEHKLISSGAENSVTAAFQTLLASRFARHGEVVMGLTREMLRPMLKAWLDANLPAIVERVVKAEIERIARSE